MNIKMGAKSPFVFPSVVYCSFIHFCVSSGFRQLDGKMPDGLQMQFYIFFDELWQTDDAGFGVVCRRLILRDHAACVNVRPAGGGGGL